MSEEKKQYEISYLARAESDKEEILKSLRDSAVVNLQEKKPFEVKLAYPIKKQTLAFLGWFVFEASPEVISKINNSLKFSEGILRFLIIILPSQKINLRLNNKEQAAKEVLAIDNDKITETLLSAEQEVIETKSNEDVDDAVFNEKLEEILANNQIK